MSQEKFAEELLASADTEIQALGQTGSPPGRLFENDNFLYGILATQANPE
jgi:hypothetical protein